MERKFLSVDEIIVEDRMRDLDLGWVEALADDIAEKGQLQPIGVRTEKDKFILVFGGHRLAAHRLLGKATIDVKVLPITAAQAKVMEIDENILRMPFAPLTFARSLAKRKAIYEEAYPLSKHGAKGLIAANTPSDQDQEKSDQSPSGKDCQLVEVAQGFSENTAEKLGVSPRKIRLAIWLHKNFDPVAEMTLKGHAIMDNASQLHALAKFGRLDQEKIATLIAEGTCKNVADAEAHITGKVQPSADAKSREKFISHWARSTSKMKADLLSELAGTTLPKGYRIITPESEHG